MSLAKKSLFVLLFIISQKIADANPFSVFMNVDDYYVIVLPPTSVNGCKVYEVRVYHDNGTPLDPSDDTLAASGFIGDCPGNEISNGDYFGTLDEIIEGPQGSCDGAVISIYDAVGSAFQTKGIITINCPE